MGSCPQSQVVDSVCVQQIARRENRGPVRKQRSISLFKRGSTETFGQVGIRPHTRRQVQPAVGGGANSRFNQKQLQQKTNYLLKRSWFWKHNITGTQFPLNTVSTGSKVRITCSAKITPTHHSVLKNGCEWGKHVYETREQWNKSRIAIQPKSQFLSSNNLENSLNQRSKKATKELLNVL